MLFTFISCEQTEENENPVTSTETTEWTTSSDKETAYPPATSDTEPKVVGYFVLKQRAIPSCATLFLEAIAYAETQDALELNALSRHAIFIGYLHTIVVFE